MSFRSLSLSFLLLLIVSFAGSAAVKSDAAGEPPKPRVSITDTSRELVGLPEVGSCTFASISCDTTVNGTLESGDCLSTVDSYLDWWSFQGTAGQTVTITMSSSDFDAYVGLVDPDGTTVASDDDSGGNLNARLTYTLSSSGTWDIYATQWVAETGSYTVNLDCGTQSSSEREALIDFYNSTNGAGWFDDTGWLGAPGTECSWSGVSCDEAGHVTGLYLPVNQLSGEIPESIGALVYLEALRLWENQLSGSIPDSIGSLTSLANLDLSDNQLSGSIPDSMRNLVNLYRLSLFMNQLTGSIPEWIGELSGLEVLYLSSNELSGSIPSSIGNLTNLEDVTLHNNQLSGPIPASVTNLTNLERLSASTNELSGSIPSSIGNLVNLRRLSLWSNRLSGPIPISIGQLSNLETLYLSKNELSGSIPSSIGNLTNLKETTLYANQLTGSIPESLGNLTNLTRFEVSRNQLSGSIPSSIGNLASIELFNSWGNQLTGSIPDSIGNLSTIDRLWLSNNQLSGPIPEALWNLTSLRELTLWNNRLTGSISSSIGSLTNLEKLWLNGNLLTGPIPASIGSLTNLQVLGLYANQLSGSIPGSIGNLSNLERLWLGSNLLGGNIPNEVGQLSGLESLYLAFNNLRGEVPRSILNLVNVYWIGLEDNALRASDPEVAAFLESTGPFLYWQTVPPENVRVDSVTPYTATLSWTPILYQWGPGGYQVLGSTSSTGPYAPLTTTSGKDASSAIVTGLVPAMRYYFVVKAVTYPFSGEGYYQLNTVFSDPSTPQVSATTLAPTSVVPEVILSSSTSGLAQPPGVGGAADSYSLTNVGGRPTSINLTQAGTFFQHAPVSFTLGPGASQVVTITGLPMSEGEYSGTSSPSGEGVPSGLAVPVRLVSAEGSGSGFIVRADETRLDLVAPEGENPTGSLTFRNSGTGAFTGVASSDVEFLVPQQGLLSIPAGGSLTLSVMADREKRPDADLLFGTQTGRVSLIAIEGVAGAAREPSNGGTNASLVTVVDTVKPNTAETVIPSLAFGEVALFLASVGHVVGSVGTFQSDISILNAYGVNPAELDVFYTPLSPGAKTETASLKSLSSNRAVALADVVKAVFGGDSEIGSLQIRSSKAAALSVSANILATSDPRGNYGTAIPVLRSDRSARSGKEIVLTGLRKDETSHTNLYLQETTGSAVSVSVEFLDASGRSAGQEFLEVGPFEMTRLVDRLPFGGVAVRIRCVGGDGAISAYATPVDRASGDTWAVADWALQMGYGSSEPTVIPVGGSVHGANNTYFHTDVAITNRCGTTSAGDGEVISEPTIGEACTEGLSRGVLRYYPTTGGVQEKEIVLGPFESAVMDDVIQSTFGIAVDTVGHLVFEPIAGQFATTSRTYTSIEGSPATFGSAVPAIGISRALRAGQTLKIGALDDSTDRTIASVTPRTNRTNFGIVETSGEQATVSVSVFLNDPRSLAAGVARGTKVYELAPHQFLSKSLLVREIVGAEERAKLKDLSGVQIHVTVLSQTGAVMVYTSSVDNGTGDSILRVE